MAARDQNERFHRQLEREDAREQAQRDREAQKAAKEQYLQSRQEEAAELTARAGRARAALDDLLVRALAPPVRPLDLGTLKRPAPTLPLDLGADAAPIPRPEWTDFTPAAPGLVGRMLGGQARHERALAEARTRFEEATTAHTAAETARQARSRRPADSTPIAKPRRSAAPTRSTPSSTASSTAYGLATGTR